MIKKHIKALWVRISTIHFVNRSDSANIGRRIDRSRWSTQPDSSRSSARLVMVVNMVWPVLDVDSGWLSWSSVWDYRHVHRAEPFCSLTRVDPLSTMDPGWTDSTVGCGRPWTWAVSPVRPVSSVGTWWLISAFDTVRPVSIFGPTLPDCLVSTFDFSRFETVWLQLWFRLKILFLRIC